MKKTNTSITLDFDLYNWLKARYGNVSKGINEIVKLYKDNRDEIRMSKKRHIFKCEICEHKQPVNDTTYKAFYRPTSAFKIQCNLCGNDCYDTGYME